MTDNFLSFSKDAAKTLGLSEAVVLETIKTKIQSQNNQFIELDSVLKETIFWDEKKTITLISKLQLRGLVNFDKDKKRISLVLSKKKIKDTNVDEKGFGERTESFMEKNWEPDAALIDQASEYGISKSFVLSQLDDFIHLHREKSDTSYSWGVKFLRFVIKKWRSQEISDIKQLKRKPIDQSWQPDEEAIEILTKAGINKEFIKNEIPEFILYWSEKGDVSDTWNSKFIGQVRRQWAKTQHLIDNSELPEPISPDWKPNQDFYEVLALTEIDKTFADSVLNEFILYWKETGQAHNSWNSKFFQHVKYQWQRQQGFNQSQPLNDVDRRIQSSWDLKTEEKTEEIELISKKKVKSKLEELKKKHLI
ncbi:uncharacterized protein METZ01_LOCUS39460 [marine metagenome]|uniref:DnaT DNA-binding domain-containing protein n=1 Tax=marine metagenome TaxID=408172 RepID=A0A381R4C6_9ZZZZ|tara:strand:+ start:693 stop:1784 length:1092 start_codon:yes stop_codon:yes gene_type:complete